METKVCTKCLEAKPTAEFCKKLNKKTAQCKYCLSTARQAYRKLNPELVKKQKQISRLNNIDKELKKSKEKYTKNKEKIKEQARLYYYVNREKEKLRMKKRSRGLQHKYYAASQSAKRRNITFSISKEEYIEIIKDDKCFYCQGKLPETGSGLDRIDNSKDIGYTKVNVVACCTACNQIRGDHLSHIEMIAVALFIKGLRNEK